VKEKEEMEVVVGLKWMDVEEGKKRVIYPDIVRRREESENNKT
jgi:hypothetical protein